jgi:hypothetical protein
VQEDFYLVRKDVSSESGEGIWKNHSEPGLTFIILDSKEVWELTKGYENHSLESREALSTQSRDYYYPGSILTF